jgi:hypothetical protein
MVPTTLKIFVRMAVIALFFLWLATCVSGQAVVDRSIATVNDGVRSELITYSDLLWQLALQPGTPLDPPSTEDLNRALQRVIDQRLFALEADRLPREAPTQAEIDQKVKEILSFFPSTADFERRLRTVGFDSVRDPDFIRIIEERVRIDKYLAFRFRAFIVITPEDEAKYYDQIYIPEFRRKYPGVVIPNLEDKRAEINSILTENKVAANIESFLDEAKRRVEIVILNEV